MHDYLLDPTKLGGTTVTVMAIVAFGTLVVAKRAMSTTFAVFCLVVTCVTAAIKNAPHLAVVVIIIALVAVGLGIRHFAQGLKPINEVNDIRYPWLAAGAHLAPAALGIQYFWNNSGDDWHARFGSGVWVTIGLFTLAVAIAAAEVPRRLYLQRRRA